MSQELRQFVLCRWCRRRSVDVAFIMREGGILTPSFSTSLLPTALDLPDELVSVFLTTPDATGPFGARGVAEMAMVAVAPAVAIAIHDATGVWLDRQPMTPPRVLAALAERRDP